MSRVVIYKPNSKLNESNDNYKVVAWRKRGGAFYKLKFVKTKKQALEIQRRFRNELK